MHTEVRVKKGEVIDRALRRLKKKLDKDNSTPSYGLAKEYHSCI